MSFHVSQDSIISPLVWSVDEPDSTLPVSSPVEVAEILVEVIEPLSVDVSGVVDVTMESASDAALTCWPLELSEPASILPPPQEAKTAKIKGQDQIWDA